MTAGEPWGLEAKAVPSSAATQVTTGGRSGGKAEFRFPSI